MPTLKQRKDGDHFVHAPGDDNPVNTFQITTDGVEIVESSGRSVGEFFPDQLFFVLYELEHLSTKGAETSVEDELTDPGPVGGLRADLSGRDRVRVAVKIAKTHGVEELYGGRSAEWVCSLFELPNDVLAPLVRSVASAAGFSYETVADYESRGGSERYLEISLALHLQSCWLRDSATIDGGRRGKREVLGTEGEYVYVSVPNSDVFDLGIPEGMPAFVDEDIESELRPFWGEGIGAAGFAALHKMEVRRRYDEEHGVVLPRTRLRDVVDLPARSELTELYEAVRLLEGAIERVLSAPETGVAPGDGSACDRWYHDIEDYRTGAGMDGAPSLGAQHPGRTTGYKRTGIATVTGRE